MFITFYNLPCIIIQNRLKHNFACVIDDGLVILYVVLSLSSLRKEQRLIYSRCRPFSNSPNFKTKCMVVFHTCLASFQDQLCWYIITAWSLYFFPMNLLPIFVTKKRFKFIFMFYDVEVWLVSFFGWGTHFMSVIVSGLFFPSIWYFLGFGVKIFHVHHW